MILTTVSCYDTVHFDKDVGFNSQGFPPCWRTITGIMRRAYNITDNAFTMDLP